MQPRGATPKPNRPLRSAHAYTLFGSLSPPPFLHLVSFLGLLSSFGPYPSAALILRLLSPCFPSTFLGHLSRFPHPMPLAHRADTELNFPFPHVGPSLLLFCGPPLAPHFIRPPSSLAFQPFLPPLTLPNTESYLASTVLGPM